MGEIWTQGTQMYVCGAGAQGQITVVEVGGVKGFTPPTPTKNEIDITTLKDKAKRYMNGLTDPGEGNISMNYLEGDKGQQILSDAYDNNESVEIIVGLDNGYGIGVEKTEDGYELPDTRGWLVFSGPVKQYSIEIGEDAAVGATAVIKSSGEPKLHRKK